MSEDQFSLQGRVALVTGASSGLGNDVAKGLAKNGATVVVAARRADRLRDLVGEIESLGGKAVSVNMDVANRESVNAAFSEAFISLMIIHENIYFLI